jgi:hypothetical protein
MVEVNTAISVDGAKMINESDTFTELLNTPNIPNIGGLNDDDKPP